MSNDNTSTTTSTNTTTNTTSNNNKILFQLKPNDNKKTKKNNSNLIFIEEYDSEKEEDNLLKKSKEASQKRKRENKPLVIPVVNNNKSNDDNKKHKLVIERSSSTTGNKDEEQKQQQPILLANRIADLSKITNEKEKLQKDLSLRATDILETSNVYYNVPVEEFGAAMLRGMGWKGSEKALNDKEDDDVPRRYYRLGLGSMVNTATATNRNASDIDRNNKNNGDDKNEKEIILNKEKEEEKKRELCQKELQVGSIITLPNNNNRAKVLQSLGVPGLNQIKIQYENESNYVNVNRREIILTPYHDLKMNPFMQKNTDTTTTTNTTPSSDTKSTSQSTKPKSDVTNTNNNSSNNKSNNNIKEKNKSMKKQSSSWLTPNIKVRIISKSYKKGKYYKLKGIVLDTPTHNEAFMQIIDNNNSSITLTVPQQYLETVIPKTNKYIMVVKESSKYRYQKGVVTKRNFDKGRVYVQLLDNDIDDDDIIIKFDLNDVSEYCGDL